MVFRRTVWAVMAEPAIWAMARKLMGELLGPRRGRWRGKGRLHRAGHSDEVGPSLSRDGLLQALELHVDEAQAHLEVGRVLRERRLLDTEFHGVAVLRGMLGQPVHQLRRTAVQ